MDPYDQALLTYALRWCNYGGGDEQIFPEFGLTPEAFYRRVLDLVDGYIELDCRTVTHLRTHCNEKVSTPAQAQNN